ncbi:exodeoxyribonuclease V subunit beta, partial [Vibrio astriarenae]
VYACFIGASPLRNGRSTKEPTGVHQSAIGYLVQNGQEGGINDLFLGLKKQQESLDSVVICDPPKQHDEMYVAEQAELAELTAKELQNSIDRNWRITSYSGLVKQGSHHAEHDAMIEITGFDIDSSEEQDEAELVEPERSIFNFPRGARPGT